VVSRRAGIGAHHRWLKGHAVHIPYDPLCSALWLAPQRLCREVTLIFAGGGAGSGRTLGSRKGGERQRGKDRSDARRFGTAVSRHTSPLGDGVGGRSKRFKAV
jgi:hypothetical protein